MSQVAVIEEEDLDVEDMEIEEEDEDEEEDEEKEASSEPEAEVEEEEEEEAPSKKNENSKGKGKAKKKRGPPKRKRPPANRNQKIPNYDTHLRKIRKPPSDGEEPKKKSKLRSGTKAARESRYLQEVATSGTFFAAQPMKRVVKEALLECAEEMQAATLEWEQLNEATGKKFATPLNKGVDKWRISSEAVQKILAGGQKYVDSLAQVSHDIHVARKSVTVTGEDVELAHKFVTTTF